MTAIDVRPPPPAPPAGSSGPRRLGATVRTTPGRLSITVFILVLLGMSVGVSSLLALQERINALRNLTVVGGPSGASALDIYRSLSDADAAAASEFLAVRADPSGLRARYLDDIARATSALTVASSYAANDPRALDELVVLASQIPVYTGLVETARANNRQGFPVGSAYLREASGLMRNTLLPAAQRLYEAEIGALAKAKTSASTAPLAGLALIAAALLALLITQVTLARRTKRVFNVGLVVATLAMLAAGTWMGLASSAMAEDLEIAHDQGAAQAQILTEARIAALHGRTDEALTLVGRGSGQDFEADFNATLQRLDKLLLDAEAEALDESMRSTLALARDDLHEWLAVHKQVRQFDAEGRYPDAVALVTDPTKSGPILFAKLDKRLGDGIDEHRTLFVTGAAAAGKDLAGLLPGVLVLTLVMLVGTAVGLWARIAEYR